MHDILFFKEVSMADKVSPSSTYVWYELEVLVRASFNGPIKSRPHQPSLEGSITANQTFVSMGR
jgi:hypothetical protein